ncbi:MAG: nuclear transport factor 2 family protein [Sphingomonadales bacterium]|nr:MAG: nuclear transport factor 2 family protein [Sphingomonadales bacterium]
MTAVTSDASIELRLQRLEDQLEIIRLLSAYGPLVDAGACDPAAELWEADGRYDVGGEHVATGVEQIAALYSGDGHQSLIRQGSGHVTTTPHIRLDGDTATAFAHSFVLLRGARGWAVWRASANRWTLARTADGWRIRERVNRVLDGASKSHKLMGEIQYD